MGRQIVKSPEGRYQVFSTEVDQFLFEEPATRTQLRNWLIKEAMETAQESIDKLLRSVDEKGPKTYFQFGMTWEECVEEDRRNKKKEGIHSEGE